jgi:hypothetical protein
LRTITKNIIELEVLRTFTEEIKVKNPVIEVVTTATCSGG